MEKLNKIAVSLRRQPVWRLAAAGALLLVVLLLLLFSPGQKKATDSLTFTARRGDLEIKVLEGGSLEALESQELKCEPRVGYQGTKILKIIEEGYFVTEEDVKNKKVLCELDSSDLEKQLLQQEIQYQSALANFTDAQQNFEIQVSQNQSDVQAAEQKARFARMDLDKYLGDSVAEQVVKQTGLDDYLAAVSTNNLQATMLPDRDAGGKPVSCAPGETNSAPAGSFATNVQSLVQTQKASVSTVPAPGTNPPAGTARQEPDPEAICTPSPALQMPAIKVDFSRFVDIDALGDGEAKQKLRKCQDDLQVAQKELGQASTALEGTRRLFAKEFVPKTEVTRDEIANESARLKVQTAETAQRLFQKYELPRTVEEDLSKYAEGVREIDKARRVAISKLAQVQARLNSAKGQYEVQSRQRQDLMQQLEKCILRSEKSGLVVYGGNRDNPYGQEPIREGATVRERQAIITIPDLTRMSVNVKIHESYIKKIQKGQKARIVVDAFPDQMLTGEVTKVAVLPDSQNRWMNPDLKVYPTTITIDSTNDWLKPGMSARVEILVNSLENVIYVPMQAISPDNGKQVCYVATGFSAQRRQVEVGEFTDEFIEIKSGLKEGERVLLRPPGGAEPQTAEPQAKPAGKDKQPPKKSAPTETAKTSKPAAQ